MKNRTATALDSKISLKIRIFDSIVISSLFLSLLPIRLAFVHYVGDHWFGSFGVMTVTATVVIYLTYKNKLGWFGRSVQRFFRKRHTKKRILFIAQFIIATSMISIFIYGVNYAEDKFEFEKTEILALLPNEGMDTMEGMTDKALDEVIDKPEMMLYAIVIFAYYMLFDFDHYSLAVWTINEITEGLYLNLGSVFLVEEIEVFGIFVFFHFYGKKLTPKEQ